MSLMRFINWRAIRNVLLTAVVGPLFGALFVFAVLVAPDYIASGSFSSVPESMISVLIVFGYLFGGIPAVAYGIIVCLIAPWCSTRLRRLISAPIVGVLATVGFFIIYARVAHDSTVTDAGVLILGAGCGAFAAVLCSLILEWLGWSQPRRSTS